MGKTYVLLDPSYPQDRLMYMLEGAQAGIILTNTRNMACAATLQRYGQKIINLDTLPVDLGNDEPQLSVAPERLAYILYAHGSTGRPKGVMQNHRNVLHHIRVYTNNLHISAQDRLTLLSSYSFDAAIIDIFGALLNGATLYPINIKADPIEDIIQWCELEERTIYHSTPTVYRYLVSALPAAARISTLRLVVLGGEEVTRREVALYTQHFSPTCLLVR